MTLARLWLHPSKKESIILATGRGKAFMLQPGVVVVVDVVAVDVVGVRRSHDGVR